MNKLLILLFFISFNVFANAMDDQLRSFSNLENQINLENQQVKKRKMAIRKLELKREQIRKAKIEKRRLASIARTAKMKRARAKVLENRMLADKHRDQDYEDKLRNLQLETIESSLLNNDNDRDYIREKRKLELIQSKARANRVNEYIDNELNKSKAETDVIQSQADGVRNVTTGKNLQQKGLWD